MCISAQWKFFFEAHTLFCKILYLLLHKNHQNIESSPNACYILVLKNILVLKQSLMLKNIFF